jgi:G3E family GTPase
VYIKPCKITLITGFLGAGKTTFVNHLLTHNNGCKFAVLVNDIGEINVDAKLIDSLGYKKAGISSDGLIALTNGCICCTLKDQLIEQLSELSRTLRFDHILIEASGICEPAPIVQNISYYSQKLIDQGGQHFFELDSVVCLVDARRMSKEFHNGKDLIGKNYSKGEIGSLLQEQLQMCQVLILNKMGSLSKSDQQDVYNNFSCLQPNAEIIPADYADVGIDKILDKSSFVFEKESQTKTWKNALLEEEKKALPETDEYDIQTYCYSSRQPFNDERFKELLFQNSFMKTILRSKGICYFSSDFDNAYVEESVGPDATIQPFGKWVGAADSDTVPDILKQNPSLKSEWDPNYQDRKEEIVFIGQKLDKKKLKELLDSCLDE